MLSAELRVTIGDDGTNSKLLFERVRITQSPELKTQNFPVAQHFEGLGINNETRENDYD